MNTQNDFSQTNVLVTGADGFIGSHLAETLVKSGARVRALALYQPLGGRGWLDWIDSQARKQIEVISGDARDEGQVYELMKGIDTVFHLAALIGIPYSYKAPQSYIETNVTGTLNVLEAARKLGTGKVIVTSTSEVYGSAQFVPITEAHPLNPQSPYAASKAAADHLALSFHRSFQLPVAVVRPFNAYGPRQSARAVIPAIIGQVIAGAKEIKLGAVTPTRDFTFVKDTVLGFVLAALSDKAVGEVVNLGSNFEISVGEVVSTIATLMDAKLKVECDETRLRPKNSEVERLWADNSKAKRLLGWEPEFAGKEGFKKGLAETIAWYRGEGSTRLYRPLEYQV